MKDLSEQMQLAEELGRRAHAASQKLAKSGAEHLNEALGLIAAALHSRRDQILKANEADVSSAKKEGLSSALVDRLVLNSARWDGLLESVGKVAALPSVLGTVIREWTRPNGLRIQKVRVPIGVIAIFYEARPNVTVDAAVLCIKAGNAVILRGGREAFRTNTVLVEAIRDGLDKAGLPSDTVQLVPTVEREMVPLLCRLDRWINLVIPRGGKRLVETVVENARMAVLKHAEGICHVYVHKDADLAMAQEILVNAKCQRPSVCNAMETLLVDEELACGKLRELLQPLREAGVEIRGDPLALKYGGPGILPATEEDWSTEYLDLILSVRVVPGLDGAIEHIEQYGSHHSDAIVTNNAEAAERFLREVDSAVVYWNASTRFTDGGEFGFGTEIGISTGKFHARGPMGLEDLCSYKYCVIGRGTVRT
ncbi:glutamate-5-semialdehyde dehydrogenase [Candidatus Methylacidithermus pantelleriae]|uniref:Gamma-glutamyl phosphate reductase n=1 Tax=Candidatus Methylacidithermus pantelleriae TaxID=2744239 RepID=A0A8J2FPE7_9BACT|nr:glutamate-5-semialdehyde dehydrogenase [Candidatus Methylacidithermus pantelleriae]CAF0702281.1 glutamate-5-semialdehyde dehydrogenase [Candidatus Methylacidithermus pantelleriae]